MEIKSWLLLKKPAAASPCTASLVFKPRKEIRLKIKKPEKLRESRAAGFADDFLKKLRFVGCQAVGAGIYLSGNEQAHRADSRKSAAKPTPFRKSNATLQKHYA